MRICRALWTGEPIDFDGRFHTYRDLAIAPTPVQDPCPVMIAANPWNPAFADRALRRVAGLADGWMTASSWPGLFDGLWERLRALLAAAGRDPGAFPISAMHNVSIGQDREACLAETSRFIAAHENGEEPPREMVTAWTAAGRPAECAADLRALLDGGATHLVLRPTSRDQRTQLSRLVEEVLPLV